MAGSTKLALNLEEDSDFRVYIKAEISKIIGSVLRDELKGIVAGELARLRLTDPTNMPMSEIVDSAVKYQFKDAKLQQHIRDSIITASKQEVQTNLKPELQAFKDRMASAFRNTTYSL